MEDNTSHIVTDDKATARWRWFTRRTVLLPLCAILLVLVCVWVFVLSNQSSDKKKTAVESAIAAADAAFEAGDYSKSYEELKLASDSASTTKEKAEIYAQLSAAAANTGQFQDAIKYLDRRHELDPQTIGEDAYIMGGYYEVLEDEPNAIMQYKLSLEYQKSQPKTLQSQANIESLEARISSLEEGE